MALFISVVFIGIGATAVMDLWGLLRGPLLGLPAPDYGLVGRWFAYLARGRFRHDAIARTTPVRGERWLGWGMHYLTGMAFAALLMGWQGRAWLEQPAILPALVIGVGTVLAPFLVMQPGMGAGIAASRTPKPWSARLQTLLTHTIFGVGLYVAGWGLHLMSIH